MESIGTFVMGIYAGDTAASIWYGTFQLWHESTAKTLVSFVLILAIVVVVSAYVYALYYLTMRWVAK